MARDYWHYQLIIYLHKKKYEFSCLNSAFNISCLTFISIAVFVCNSPVHLTKVLSSNSLNKSGSTCVSIRSLILYLFHLSLRVLSYCWILLRIQNWLPFLTCCPSLTYIYKACTLHRNSTNTLELELDSVIRNQIARPAKTVLPSIKWGICFSPFLV